MTKRDEIIEVMARALIKRIGSPWPFDDMEPMIRELWMGHAATALTALEQSGYIVRPREATEAMIMHGAWSHNPDDMTEQQYKLRVLSVKVSDNAMTEAWEKEQSNDVGSI